MQRLTRRGDALDYLLLANELKDMKLENEYGGLPYLLKLINDAPNAYHAEIYGRLISRCAARRKLMEQADKIKTLSQDDELTLEQVLDQSESALLKLRASRNEYSRLTMQQAMDTADKLLLKRMAIYAANPDYTLGIRTGFQELDKTLDGLPVGITTLAGVTGMGKTACVLTMAMNASRAGIDREEKRPAKVNLFSGEMTQEQLSWRLLSMKSGVPMERIQRGSMNDPEQARYIAARNNLISNHTMTFESMKRMTVHQIRDTVRQLVNEGQLDLLVIDGLLQIDALKTSASASGKERGFMLDKRRDSIEYILNELEDITTTYETRVLLTHQISRKPADRQNKRPVLSDLAEANFVEQKSSVVLFLYRDGYYNTGVDPEATELIIAKNRNGLSSVTTYLLFNSQYTRFENGTLVHVNLSED
jgi:replicative DNA helicase